MEWRHLDFDWNHARALLATAEEGSYSAAARVLGTTQPTIGRQIAAMEETLGVVLFERAGRGLSPTPAGIELVSHARAMGEAAFRLARVAAGQSVDVDGRVRISAGEIAAAEMLPPIVAKVRARHPGIIVEIVATNQVSDLGLREADIALRNFRPKDEALIAKKVRQDMGYFYATPGYLASIGDPTSLHELGQRAEFIAFDETDAFKNYLEALGVPTTERSFPYVSESQRVQWALITQGSGIGVMMESVGDADERVVRVLPDHLAAPVETWLTSHREVRTSRRVRIVFDMLAEGLAQ